MAAMEQIATELDGPVLIQPARFGDARGFFAETFRESTLGERFGITAHFVQDNHSRSARGVLRGMHFQPEPPAAKLVRCARGAIVDVLVDIRPESRHVRPLGGLPSSTTRTCGRSTRRSASRTGSACVSDVADVIYKQTAYWSADADRGFAPDDPEVGIEWPLPPEQRLLSERDRDAPSFADVAAVLRRA